MTSVAAAVAPEFNAAPATGAEGHFPSWAEEILTPEQFFLPAADSSAAWTGERRLLFAVLQDAVDMFFRYRRSQTIRGQRLFRETVTWFLATDRSWLCSFESICDHLGLDADYIRLGLKRLNGGVLLREPAPIQRRRRKRAAYLTLVRDAGNFPAES